MRDAVDVGPQRRDRVDAQPQQVRRVEVEVQPELEHPLPQLGRVGEVAGVAVGVPALHHAVLDHQPHAALAGVVDERREDALGLAQVLGDAAAGVAADERADGHAAERGGGVDAGAQVGVDRLALGRVGVQVVVVVGERRQRRGRCARAPRARARPPRRRSASAATWLRGEGPVAELAATPRARAPRSRSRRPSAAIVLERALGHAGGEEAELHAATASLGRRHVDPLAARAPSASTASVMRAARRPSANVGQPVGRLAGRDRRVDVGDEGVEAVGVALRVAGRAASRSAPPPASSDRGRGGRSARRSRRPTQSDSGSSWSKASASSAPSSSSQRRFLRPAETWLIDDRAERAAVGLELHDGGVLGADRRAARRRRRRRRTPCRSASDARSGTAVSVPRESRVMRWPGHELGEVAPVRADVGERARRAAELRRRRASCRPRAGAASPAGRCRGPGARAPVSPARDPLARLADRRVVAVDERHGGLASGDSAAASTSALRARSASSASGFSQTTCLPAASAASASGRWRWLGVQMWTTSTSGSPRPAPRRWRRRARRRARAAAAWRCSGWRRRRRPARAGERGRSGRGRRR